MILSGPMGNDQVPKKLLVVDNARVILDLLELVLSREGYQVTTTPCSDEVVGLTSREGFDLAIVDVGLRRGNGRTLMKMIREASPETPIVVMTGYPTEEITRIAQRHAQGYLEKPFALQELLAVVRCAIEERLMYTRKARVGPAPASIAAPLCPQGAA